MSKNFFVKSLHLTALAILFIFSTVSRGYANCPDQNPLYQYDILLSPPSDFPSYTVGTSHPGSRSHGASWTDRNGNFWLFGGLPGLGNLGDLWKFELQSAKWTCVQRGGAGPKNLVNPISWLGTDGNLWMYGGRGASYDVNTVVGDVWKFDIIAQHWILLFDAERFDPTPVYPGEGNPYPGKRSDGGCWVRPDGIVMVFGGEDGLGLKRNDIWAYDSDKNQWSYVGISGFNSGDHHIYNGSDDSELPTPRTGVAAWGDSEGNGWIFGGIDSNSKTNDLWKFDIKGNTWKIVSSENQIPQPRSKAASWKDGEGNFYLWGGLSYLQDENKLEKQMIFERFSDLWKYEISQNRWEEIPLKGGEVLSLGLEGQFVFPQSNGSVTFFGGRSKNKIERFFFSFKTTNTHTFSTSIGRAIVIELSPRSGSSTIEYVEGSSSHGTITRVDNLSNKFVYSPNDLFYGSDTFQFLEKPVQPDCPPSMIEVRGIVYPLYSCPEGPNISVYTEVNQDIDIDLGVRSYPGYKLTYEYGKPKNGALIELPDSKGKVRYTPNSGFIGNDTFSFIVTDGICSNIFNVSIKVGRICPTVEEKAHSMDEGESLEIIIPLTTENDEIIIVNNPSNGRLVQTDKMKLLYTPNFNFVGMDKFDYKIKNSDCESETVSHTVDVKLIYPPPVFEKFEIDDQGKPYIFNPIVVNAKVVNEDHTIRYRYSYGDQYGMDKFFHYYREPGTYTITVVASDGRKETSISGTVTVYERPLHDLNRDGLINSMDKDTDGDKFSDVLEVLMGSNYKHHHDYPRPPFGADQKEVDVILTKQKVNVKSRKSGIDYVKIKGITYCRTYNNRDFKVALNLGGISRLIYTDEKGKGQSDGVQLKLRRIIGHELEFIITVKTPAMEQWKNNSHYNASKKKLESLTLDLVIDGRVGSAHTKVKHSN